MTPKKIWDKSAGYKTKSGAFLYLLFELFKKLFPDLLDEVGETIIKYLIEALILTGGLDWVWRNRREVIQWVKELFKKK